MRVHNARLYLDWSLVVGGWGHALSLFKQLLVPDRPAFKRYSFALFASVLAVVVSWAGWPLFEKYPLYPSMFAATVALAYGGVGPALVCIVASILPVNYFFIEDRTYSASFTFRLMLVCAEVMVAGVLRQAWMKNELSNRGMDAALRQREQFMAIAAHELKTPISAMKMQIEMMKKHCHDEAMLKRIQMLQRQVGRLTDLISSLMDVTRMNVKKLDLNPIPVNLSAVMTDLVNRHQEYFSRAMCEVTVKVEPNVTGEWDLMRLEQIILNLVSNACKYGHGKPIHIEVWAEEDAAFFSIEDHGIGIAKSDQQRIFEQFQRAVTDNNYSGLGLGLWITSEIVKAKGGSITVASELGNGATFTVCLPRYCNGKQLQRQGELSGSGGKEGDRQGSPCGDRRGRALDPQGAYSRRL